MHVGALQLTTYVPVLSKGGHRQASSHRGKPNDVHLQQIIIPRIRVIKQCGAAESYQLTIEVQWKNITSYCDGH